jgi:hypothetical protein
MSSLDYQVSRANPSKVGGSGTTVKYFPRPIGQSLTSGQPTTPNASSPVGSLWVPVGPQFDGQQLTVQASGSFGSDTGDPSGTVSFSLYTVTGTLAVPVYTQIATTTAITPAFPSEVWTLKTTLIGGNGMLLGWYEGAIRGTVVPPTTLINVVTGLDFQNGNPALQRGAVCGLVIGVTFGTSDASNTASLTQFAVNQ